MPRTARSIEAGTVYHVLNRGNGRMRLFHKDADYEAFERVLTEGFSRYPVDLPAYCLMPNHRHPVVRPNTGEALGRLMGWVGVTHVRWHHEHYRQRGAGHLYQRRFKSFPVAEVMGLWVMRSTLGYGVNSRLLTDLAGCVKCQELTPFSFGNLWRFVPNNAGRFRGGPAMSRWLRAPSSSRQSARQAAYPDDRIWHLRRPISRSP